MGRLTQLPDTNTVKLPNISASVPQLTAAIKELQEKGYAIPDYPADPKTDEEKDINERYAKCLGSAVNPVLREGNSDRRAPRAVKEYARKHPHSMGKWSMASRTHMACMRDGDFYDLEVSMTLDRDRDVKMELMTTRGEAIVLKPKVSLNAGDIVDAMAMSRKELCDFYEEQIAGRVRNRRAVLAACQGHDDEGQSSHRVRPRGQDLLQGRVRQASGAVRRTGRQRQQRHGRPVRQIESLPAAKRDEIIQDLHACHEHRPELAMVDSARGISNFHSPSDVIVDASMPAMIRAGGKMYGADGKLKDTKAVNPESTFSRIYQEMINFCKTNGQFDPTTMGTVPNVGLMAQKAEEYGSHDKTFEIPEDGVANFVDLSTGEVLLSQDVETGDIWRMCIVKDAPIRDWVKLAVTRARNSGMPALFWLDPYRPHRERDDQEGQRPT